MDKLANIFQAAYIGFAALFIYKAIAEWDTNRQMSYMLFGAAILAIFKFFFNRKYRKRFDEYYKNKKK